MGSSNRKNQWQARILYHGKVTHLGYYRTEEEAARVYDKVSISLHGAGAQTNFPIDQVTFDRLTSQDKAEQSHGGPVLIQGRQVASMLLRDASYIT